MISKIRELSATRLMKEWRFELILAAIVAFIFISKNGFLLTYLKLVGWIFFGLSLALTIYISGLIEEICRQKFSISYKFRTWIGFPLFFLFFYLVQNSSDYILRNYSGYPAYVLYPCSHPPSPGEQEIEAKAFWRLKPLQDFDCGSDD